MGGRGSFSTGRETEYTYKTVDIVDGVKVLQPAKEKMSYKLPEESHSSGAYLLYSKRDGAFIQYREYNENHEVVLEVGYHNEPGMGEGKVLHVHKFTIPGVLYHKRAVRCILEPGDPLYERLRKFFKGVQEK